jgi:predicted nucleic acid-binding protein
VLVIDTSVVVKWVVPESGDGIEEGTAEALDLLPHGLIAPDCIFGEFANALFKKVLRGEIGEGQAREAVAILPTLVQFLPIATFVVPAFELALTLRHPVHDCLFLAVAQKMGIRLVSADERFVARCRAADQELPVVALGEAI